jgi:hypothetical protein
VYNTGGNVAVSVGNKVSNSRKQCKKLLGPSSILMVSQMLASLLNMNREEREQYVIRLYKEGRTISEIAGLVHKSFRDIGAITNRVKL